MDLITEQKEFLQKTIIEAVAETFSILSLTPVPIDEDMSSYIQQGVNSVIYLKGDISGRISFFTLRKNASQMVSLMLGSDVQEDSPDVMDGVGEILNMIAGGIKTRCVARGQNFEISVPSTRIISVGETDQVKRDDLIRQAFECADIDFQVSMSYRVNVTEKSPEPPAVNPKASAADLLSQLISKKGSS